MRLRPTLAVLALAGALLPAARATDLLEVWRAAAMHDPGFAAARAARAAGAAQRVQAGALWRPTMTLQAGAAWATSESSVRGARFAAPGFGQSTGVEFDTSVTGGTSTQLALALRQPLYSRERRAEGGQLEAAAEMGEREWRAAEQQLILRSAERYFAAALAAHQLRVATEQQRAVEQARTEAEDRFRIGDRPVTDVHEATARAANLQAQRLAAQGELEIQRARLADITGRPPGESLPLPARAPAAPAGESLPAWLERAVRDNPQVLLAQARLRHAREALAKTEGAFSPVLDLVARVGRDRVAGSGDFGATSQAGVQGAVGLQLTVPLATGGMRGARRDEASARLAQAEALLEQARVAAAQETRAAWTALETGRGRAAALESGWRASLARLDATRVGLQAGDRTTLDLLNAQNDAAAAELALAQARSELLLQRLRLAAAAGALDEPFLAQVNDGLHEAAAPADRLGSASARVPGTALMR